MFVEGDPVFTRDQLGVRLTRRAEPGSKNDGIHGMAPPARGDEGTAIRPCQRRGLKGDGVRGNGRVEVVGEQHPLAAERVVGGEPCAQRRVGYLRVQMRLCLVGCRGSCSGGAAGPSSAGGGRGARKRDEDPDYDDEDEDDDDDPYGLGLAEDDDDDYDDDDAGTKKRQRLSSRAATGGTKLGPPYIEVPLNTAALRGMLPISEASTSNFACPPGWEEEAIEGGRRVKKRWVRRDDTGRVVQSFDRALSKPALPKIKSPFRARVSATQTRLDVERNPIVAFLWFAPSGRPSSQTIQTPNTQTHRSAPPQTTRTRPASPWGSASAIRSAPRSRRRAPQTARPQAARPPTARTAL